MKKLKYLSATLFLALLFASTNLYAQYGEPEIRGLESPRNLFDEGYKSGFGFSLNLNDFGFGAGAQFRKGLSPYTEGLVNLKVAGLRDPSEQVFIDYYFGNRTIPSKYKRVTTIPLTVGIKRRVFAEKISDNFRVHTSINFGPALALSSPYFEDRNDNGFRETNINDFGVYEPVRDIFAGLTDLESDWGWNGELLLGIDFGNNFARLQSFQFGYSFYYFSQGLQILEPFGAQRDNVGRPIFITDPDTGFPVLQTEPANSTTKYFGSAQITFVFGWMW